MNYQLIPPPPALKHFVNHFWSMAEQSVDPTPKTFTVTCNGVPGLIFQQDPNIFTGFGGERLPQLFVFGQATKYGQLHAAGSYRTLGVSFRPSGLRSVFGLNAKELTDQHTHLGNLARTSLPERLLDCNSVEQQVSCLAEFLLAQLRRNGHENKQVDYAISALQKGRDLRAIQNELNVSERSLQRLFLTDIGIPPIMYARISRFQTAMAILREGRFRSLTDIAYSLGYFDQSHFIRDFKLFSGASPGIYFRNAVERMPGFPEWE